MDNLLFDVLSGSGALEPFLVTPAIDDLGQLDEHAIERVIEMWEVVHVILAGRNHARLAVLERGIQIHLVAQRFDQADAAVGTVDVGGGTAFNFAEPDLLETGEIDADLVVGLGQFEVPHGPSETRKDITLPIA